MDARSSRTGRIEPPPWPIMGYATYLKANPTHLIEFPPLAPMDETAHRHFKIPPREHELEDHSISKIDEGKIVHQTISRPVMAPMEEEMGSAAVSDAKPGTDCPPPDPNPNPQARPPPVRGLGPRPFKLDGAALARRRAEWEAARLLQRFKPYPYLPFPFRTPIPNLHLGFNGDLGRGVHPSPPRDTLPTEGRAAWRPQQFRPNPNLGLESHGLAQPPPRPNLRRGCRPSTPRYPVPAEMRAVWRPRQFQPNPNPDLESHGSEQPGPRPDLGGGLRPSLPGVLPGFGVGKLAEWRKALRLWELTLKHESRLSLPPPLAFFLP